MQIITSDRFLYLTYGGVIGVDVHGSGGRVDARVIPLLWGPLRLILLLGVVEVSLLKSILLTVLLLLGSIHIPLHR